MASHINLKTDLLQKQTKAHTARLVDYIGQDPARFSNLMQLFLSQETRLNLRAVAIMSACLHKHPYLLAPYLEALILNLNRPVSNTAKRNTLRVLQHQDIPRDLQGPLAETCFHYLSGQEPPSIKAFSLTIIANLARSEPDLNNELLLLIEDQWPYASPAFKSRANKILQAMQKR